MTAAPPDLTDDDYRALADFRHALRRFHAFSEEKAVAQGLTPQQHQALLAIRAAQGHIPVTVGYIAERLILKPHSATGLIDRLVALELVAREPAAQDRRQTLLTLTDRAREVLAHLSATHREEILRIKPLLSLLLARIDAR